MTTAGIDPNLAHNIQLLQKQSLQVEFHLDHTDYKKVENIGTGAYGVVCSAINRKTRQKVAIKKIPNIFTMDPRYAIRTYREIKILQHFKHGNVIAIREILQPACKDVTDIYVVMDLMESDLHRIIYSKQALTDEHVMYFLYQILRGLKYIHSANVIHRDLKPSNLLVNADCELKIGDFGMARGINFKAEKSNLYMTQYVATRWYRAPEIIVAGRQGYGPAIDMWSVGCIFAEMLKRKHLFPGRDLLNQLAVIFGTLGIPSKDYLDKLDSDTVCGFIRKVTESNEFKPKTCAEICPKASGNALDLLSKMLVIEPEKRIDVETALAHPFLSKYHDMSFEPRCNKKFDFAFEQELFNLNTDDQKRIKIQDLLRKEVSSYSKPTPVDFGALISTKSQDSSQNNTNNEDDNPYADLNAFLAQLASSDKNTDDTTSGNPLLSVKTTQPSNSLLAAQTATSLLVSQSQGNSLLAAQNKNPLLAGSQNTNPLLAGSQAIKSDTKVNPLLVQERKLPFQGSSSNPLLLGASKANPLLQNSTNNPLLQNSTNNPLLQNSTNNPLLQNSTSNPLLQNSTSNPLLAGSSSETAPKSPNSYESQSKGAAVTLTTSESDQSNDTELFNSFLRNRASEEKSDPNLTVNTVTKPAADDIEMISAKLEQTEITNDKPEEMESAKPLDTKSLLRQRLIDKQNSNTAGNLKGQSEKTQGKAPVTAFQRQKERKERREAKQQKAKERKRKSKEAVEKAGQLLTSEDQKMLDRWRAMQKPQHIQPKPSTQTSTASNNVIVVYPAAGAHTYITTSIPVATSKGAGISGINQVNQQQPVSQTLPTLPQTSNQGLQSHVQTLNQAISSYVPPVNQAVPTHQLAGNQSQIPRSTGASVSTVASLSNISQQQQIPHIGVAQDVTMQPIPDMNSFTRSSDHRQSHQVRTFSDLAAMHGHGDQYTMDNGQETSLYDTSQCDTDAVYPNSNYGNSNYGSSNYAHIPVRQENAGHHQGDNYSHWANNITVNTSLDITGLSVPKQDDGLPPMLVSTPKGTGAGYGVGYDMESMMAFNPDLQNVNMDSAPLSASLLADWMDVTSNMDPKALEDIQHELEMSSALHDFPFNY